MMKAIRLKERQRQVREDVILDAARELLSVQGYTAMTMDDLAARVGISKATLYQHFASKEELAISVIMRMLRCSLDYLQAQDSAVPAIRRLEEVLHRMIGQRFQAGRDLGAARPALSPLLKRHAPYQNLYRGLVGALSEIVDAAKEAGDISPVIPTRVIVQVLFSLLRDAEYEDMLQSGECSAKDLSGTLVSIIFFGIRTQK